MTPRWGVALAAMAVGAVLPILPAIQAAEYATHDLRFRIRSPGKDYSKVVVVAIDTMTEREWSEPRAFWGRRLAHLVQVLDKAGVSRIGVDIILAANSDAFLEGLKVSESFRPNQEFARALEASFAPIWLATKDQGSDWAQEEFSVGEFRWASDFIPYFTQDTVRYLHAVDRGVPAFAFALAEAPSRIDGPYWIDYDQKPIPVISAHDLLTNQTDRKVLKGAVVLIGETHDASEDLHDTPLGLRRGVQIQAEAVRTLIGGNEVTVAPIAWQAFLGAIVAGLFGLFAMSWSWSRYVVIAVVASFSYLVAAHATFTSIRWMLPVAVPLSIICLAVPMIAYPVREVQRRIDLERSEADRSRIRAKWGQMIDDRLVDYIEERRGAGLGALGTVDAAFLFLDVADFTLKSNQLSPEAMLENLNRMFDALVPVIQAERGIVLSFTGDGLAAAFDQVDDEVDHRKRGLIVSLRLLEKVEGLKAQGAFTGGDWNIRIGLASGAVTLALVGSERRQTMTFYGEAVNLASRLEQAGKELGASLVMSNSYARIAKELNLAVEAQSVQLKGWAENVSVWTLTSRHKHPVLG